ncbi:MAG: hypothetical protein QM761_13100 [Pseudoxanthomonas sp.]
MPLRFPPILLFVALAGAALPRAACAGDCPALDTTATACVASAQGWFYAASEAEAADMAEAARQAAALFERHFQRPAVRGAVVSIGSGNAVSAAQKQALQAQGAAWVLPWIGPHDKRRLAEAQVRRQVEAQLGATADAAVVQATVAQALAKLPDGDGATNSALRHEIGHLLLIHAFPTAHDDATAAGNAHDYGGGLPDWLDETAAVLMEDAAMTERRRARLQRTLACGNGDRLPPLARFFVMDHPLSSVARERLAGAAASSEGGSRVLMLSGEQGRELASRGIDFYVQSRALADFLTEASGGDATIFAGIARTLAAGGDMDAWLADEGVRRGLPGDLAALQDAWQAWLDRLAATAPACEAAGESA